MKTASSPARQRKSRALHPEAREAVKSGGNFCHMLARLLIALRKHTGLSHEEIAARARISPATVRTHEAAGQRASFMDTIRICRALGFDHITVFYEVDRRLDEAGTPFLPDQKTMSERAYLKMRCSPPLDMPVAEVRRQLRVMEQLTVPKRPGPPNRKRPAASSRARATSRKTGRVTKARKG